MHSDITNDHTSNDCSPGMATKGLKKVLQVILGKRSTDSLQKTAIMGTSHIILKVLQSGT